MGGLIDEGSVRNQKVAHLIAGLFACEKQFLVEMLHERDTSSTALVAVFRKVTPAITLEVSRSCGLLELDILRALILWEFATKTAVCLFVDVRDMFQVRDRVIAIHVVQGVGGSVIYFHFPNVESRSNMACGHHAA